MQDILTRKDIEALVQSFYTTATADPLIGHFFSEVIPLDMSKHLPRISDFWDSVLLNAQSYKGNVMIKHIELDRLSALEPRHFERWLALWEAAVDHSFSGDKADEAKKRGKLMAELMKHKVQSSKGPGFIQ